MKKSKTILLIIAFLTVAVVLGYIVVNHGTKIFRGLNLLILILIIIGGTFAFISAFKRETEERKGLTTDDELSEIIKYKSGYYAYMASMYMWLFIFLLKDKFTDVETMLGGGILLSGLIAFISKMVIKRKLHA